MSVCAKENIMFFLKRRVIPLSWGDGGLLRVGC